MKLDPVKIIKIIQSQSKDFRLTKEHDLLISKATTTAEQRINFISKFMSDIS
jgi:transcription-repair coupling factor (superfamily II helicase)